MNDKRTVWCWLDCEMTGLDPYSCHIIQIAMILTDQNLEELDSPLVLNIWQPQSVLDKMCPYVRSMHEKSGLLAEVSRASIDVHDAEHAVLKLLSKYAPYRTAKLCGNSITQDRRFLWTHMPHFENYLHYRQIDVSTLKELYYWWNQKKYQKSDEGQHTALFDIRQSIEELRYYRDYAWKSDFI
jgi:oligoribonuclease